jgi:hypothetical protein
LPAFCCAFSRFSAALAAHPFARIGGHGPRISVRDVLSNANTAAKVNRFRIPKHWKNTGAAAHDIL